MKTIGLIGGMSWESSVEYYRILNETVRERLGGLHSAKSLMVSVDFAELESLQQQGKWNEAADWMIAAAQQVEHGGADCLLICANTMHKVADRVQEQIRIPLLHIADATAKAVQSRGIRTVGLLGTKFTMEEAFYTERLSDRFGLQVVIPSEDERTAIHRIIYEELCRGELNPDSKEHCLHIIERLISRGAEGIILGCTELPLLLHAEDCDVPLFDTTSIHAVAAVDYALRSV